MDIEEEVSKMWDSKEKWKAGRKIYNCKEAKVSQSATDMGLWGMILEKGFNFKQDLKSGSLA